MIEKDLSNDLIMVKGQNCAYFNRSSSYYALETFEVYTQKRCSDVFYLYLSSPGFTPLKIQ